MLSNRHTSNSRFNSRSLGRALALLAFAGSSLASHAAHAQAFDRYKLRGSFNLPSDKSPMGVTPDGRIVTLNGAQLCVESAPGSRSFGSCNALSNADIADFGAAFIRVSPDGNHVAIGNNGGQSFSNYQVGIFGLNTHLGVWFNSNHFDAVWLDNRYLAVTAGDFGSPAAVTALDTTSNPASAVTKLLINNVHGASSGIALDPARNLFTGNGFQDSVGPSVTGEVHGFLSAAWQGALTGGAANVQNFETQGKKTVTLLSASPLQFDAEGDLFVGGGAFGAKNYVGLVKASAVASALATGTAVNVNDTSVVHRFDPDTTSASTYYTVTTNPARGEFYVHQMGTSASVSWYDSSGCSSSGGRSPEAPFGAATALALGAALAFRRRRDATHSPHPT